MRGDPRSPWQSTGRAVFGLLAAACVLLLVILVSPAGMTDEISDPPVEDQSDDASAGPDPSEPDEPGRMTMANPSSLYERFLRDRESKEYLFQIPGYDRIRQPWSELRTRLDEQYGFRPAFSAAHLYQWASDTVRSGAEDDAAGFELNIDATWTFLGRGTDSPSMAGVELLYRSTAGTDIPPVALFTQAGTLYPSTVAFGEVDPSVGQLWFQQIFDDRFGFRIGKYFPISAYDFFPLKNFRFDFVDGIHAANLVIPLPDRGLGGYAVFRPRPNIYVRAGVHDANADVERSGFSSIGEGELFKILEIGFDPALRERRPRRPPFGDIHLTLWHQDERDDANVADGWGFVVAASQRFGRLLPFLRYGYSDSSRRGPAPIEQMVNGGVAIDDIFGQSHDRIGIGLTWSRPSDGRLDEQGTLDAYYRVQLTPEIAVTPTLQLIINPARNRNENEIWILGIRTRFAF